MESLEELPFDEASFKVILSPKQELFIQEYLIDFIVARASLRTGISATTGAQWLQNPVIASRIRQAHEQRLTRVKMTQEQILLEMSLLSHSRIDHYIVDDEGHIQLAEHAPAGAMAAVQSVKRKVTTRIDPQTHDVIKMVDVEIKLWDKPGPLKVMGKQIGLFPEKMEHSGPGGGPIEAVTRIERVIIRPDGQNTTA